MKFSFGKKQSLPSDMAAQPASKVKVAGNIVKPSPAVDGKKQIIAGLVFICASFLGAVFLLYLTVNAQSAKEFEVKDLNEKLLLVSTEKEAAASQAQAFKSQVGRALDLEKVVDASQKVHGEKESDRKNGSMWINRKTGSWMVTLGVLNGVTKGSRLGVFDGKNKIATLKVISALDVVSYVEPVDKEIGDFERDYYEVKSE